MMMCRVSCLVCESVCAVAAAPIDRHRVSVSMPWRGIVWRMRGGARVARTNLEVPSSSTRDVEREFCLLHPWCDCEVHERRGRCRGASPSGPRLSRGARYCPSTAVASSSCILQERRRRTPPWLASASAACHGQLQLLAAVAGSRLWRAHTQSQHALAPTCYSKCVAHPSIV